MKKLFTLLTLLLCVASSAWADEAVIYYGVSQGSNSITVNDFTIAITGNTTKNWSAGGGSISYGSTNYKTLKNSNNAQNTVTCPSGKVATAVDFYVVPNTGGEMPKLTEFDGSTCSDEVTTTKDYNNPTKISKTLDSKTSFTFTLGNKQANFIMVVTYTDAASDVVANPVINQAGTSVTMTCSTSGAKIYYTTDGTEPTVNSNLYSEAVTLDNSCSVRAKAFNGDQNQYSSDAVKKDCYIDHSTATGFVAVLGYDGGTVSGDVWTSTDGCFVLTNNVEGRGINYAGLSSGQDGFKLNHTDSYTLSAPDVKITKIVVVGKSWLQGNEGNASTIAFDGFTPTSGTFYDYPTNGETYVNTVEFTPESELDYGATIIMRPGKNQLGAYIEVYGVKRSGPADPTPVAGKTVTWDFSSETAQAAAGTITPNYSNTLTATDGSSIITYVAGDNDKYETSYLKPGGKSGISSGKYTNRYFILNITKSGTISFVGANTSTKSGNYVILQGSTEVVADAVEKGTVANTASNCSYSVNVQDGEYVFVAFSSQIYTASVSWAENSEDIELTTTSTMQGWRTFYDADNSYTVDENTKVYVATEENEGNVSLKEYAAGVPAATPVILKTNASAENDGTFKMTLTKTTETITPTYTGESLLKVTPFEGNWYRLGSKNGEVGFFPFNATGAAAGIVVLNIDSSNAGARSLDITFDDETTAIHNVNDNVNLNKVVFDLQGRRVLEPGKGLYIVNGKKVVIK